MGYYDQWGQWHEEDDIFGEDLFDGQYEETYKAPEAAVPEKPINYGSYMGKDVAPSRDPDFLQRQQELFGQQQGTIDGMSQRARDLRGQSVEATALAGMMTSGGAVLHGFKTPDASPYVDAFNKEADALDYADKSTMLNRASQEEKRSAYISEAYEDSVKNEQTEYTRKTARYQPVDGLTPDGRPVFLDKETNTFVDSRGNPVDETTIRRKGIIERGEDGNVWSIDPYSRKATPIEVDGYGNPVDNGPNYNSPQGQGDLLSAVIGNETPNGKAYDANGNLWRSPKGALGQMQVMPATARDPGYGVRPWDGKTEEDRARVGRDYLGAMTQKYGGDPRKILAAYNAGPGRVDSLIAQYGDDWLAHAPKETQDYVAKGLTRVGGNVQMAGVADRDAVGGGDMVGEANGRQLNLGSKTRGGHSSVNVGPNGGPLKQGPDGRYYELVNGKFVPIEGMAPKPASGGKGGSKGEKLTDGQRKAATFAERMREGDIDYLKNREENEYDEEGYLQNARTWVGDALGNVNKTLGGAVRGEGYQRAEQAKKAFINAYLRKESGATISPTEFERYDEEFFPQPGDDPDTIEQKNRARQRVIASMEQEAGNAIPRISSREQYDNLRPGTMYIDVRDGKTKRKNR